jgi:NAD(P)-dependent dehydrogenase (short-subunit alcohol dehydrogenase family)
MAERRHVLVTGAGRRVGRAIALDLASHGFDVALHCHRSTAEAEAVAVEARAAGAAARIFTADLSDESACRALVASALADTGRLDAVVNNASLFEYDDSASFSFARSERHWRINAGAAVLLAQALYEHLRERGAQGCVVNLLDQKLENPNPDHLSYTLSKAALAAATVMQAQALAPTLRVCAVSPGITLPSGPMTGEQFERARSLTPMRRSSTPQDIAAAVRFLIDSPAITGTTLLVDGGQHLVAQPRDVIFLTQGAGHG